MTFHLQEPELDQKILQEDLPEYNRTQVQKPEAERAANEAAFYNLTLSNSNDISGDFTRVRNNIQETGTDPDLEATKEGLSAENKQVYSEQVVEAINSSDTTLEQKKSLLKTADAEVQKAGQVNLRREFMIREASDIQNVDPENQETQDTIVSGGLIDDILEGRNEDKEVAALVNTAIANFEQNSTGEVFANLLSDAVPLNLTMSINGIVKDVFPDADLGVANLALVGESLKFLKNRIQQASGPDKIDLVKKIIDSVNKRSGIMSENDFSKWSMLIQIFDEQINTGSSTLDTDVDRWINNVVGVLDVVPFAQVAKRFFFSGKAVTVAKDTPLEALSHVNSKKTSEIASAAIEDSTGGIAKALGESKSGLIESVLYPKPLDTVSLQKMPADVAQGIEDIQVISNNIVERTESFGFAFNGTQRKAAEEAAAERLAKTEGATYYPNMSEIVSDSESLTVNARFGFDENYGFSTGLEAQRKGKELFPESEIFVLKRNRAGEIVPTKKISGKGEYFFETRTKKAFDAEDALYFPENSVNLRRLFALLPTSPATKFIRDISDTGSILPGINARVRKDMTSVIKPFGRLNSAGRNKVADAILKGFQAKKTFSYDDLVHMGFNNKEAKGYYSLRGLSDIMFIVENRKTYKQLKRDNMLEISGNKGQGGGAYRGIASPVSEGTAIARTNSAFDPSTGGIRNLSEEDITEIYKNNGSLARTYGKHVEDGHETGFVIIQGTKGTRTSPLPAKVLNYDPGYATTIYRNKYFVQETGKRLVNGRMATYTRTVNIAGTRTEAETMSKSLQASAPEGVTFTPRVDRSMREGDLAAAEIDMNMNKGALFTGKRSERLMDSLGVAEINDPIEALLKSINTVAKHASHTEVIQIMKQRFLNTYSRFKEYPLANDFKVLKGTDTRLDKELKESKAVWDYIQTLEGIDTAGKFPDIRPKIIDFGEWIIGKGDNRVKNWLGNKTIDNADIDPLGMIRAAGFNIFLRANPLRQAWVQTGQLTFLASLDPKFFGYVWSKNGLGRQKLALDLGMAGGLVSKFDQKVLHKELGKLMGISGEEYTKVLEAFKKSGLPASIDSNVFMRDNLESYVNMMFKNDAMKFVNAAFKAPKTVLKAAGSGFIFGEYNNISGTWLYARNRALSANPNLDMTARSTIDSLSADARQFSLSMTKEGSFPYQRSGFLSTMLQFVSIQHKALEAIAPMKLGGSQVFTSAEKRRMFVGQLFLFGAKAYGLSEGYKYIRDKYGLSVNPEVDKVMEGGVLEYAVNKGLQIAYDSDTQLSIAASMAPTSGILETNIMKATIDLVTGGKSPIEYVPGISALNRVFQAVSLAQSITNNPQIETKEKVLEVLKSGMGVFGGYNNFVKTRIAMTLGYKVSSFGDPTVTATYEEAMAQLFGIPSLGEESYYDVMQESYRGPGRAESEGYAEIAQDIYKNMTKRLTFIKNSAETFDDIYFQRIEEAINQENIIWSMFEPQEAQAIVEEFRKYQKKRIEDGTDKLVRIVVQTAMRGQYGSEWETVLNNLRSSNLIMSPEHEETLRKVFEDMTEEKLLAEEEADRRNK